MRPNVKTVPPRIGPSIRYHTISIKKNANPTMPAAPRLNQAGGWLVRSSTASFECPSLSAVAGGFEREPIRCAASATPRLTAHASHSVARVPNVSSMKNVEVAHPTTAPNVLMP
jgi:hypothetical protein